MSKYVLDASALIALINGEPGQDKVEKYLANACMSAVNVSEVASMLHSISMPHNEIESLISELISHIIPFDESQAFLAAQLKKSTQKHGLSLGDRACLALGKIKKIPVITADKIWAKIDLDVKIILIR